MASVEEHYELFLAPYYSWLSGGRALKLEENRRFFLDHHVRPMASKVAVDLGAGSGFQSIPLARAGFDVIAVDLNRNLLEELRQNAKGLAITTVQDDILNFTKHSMGKSELVVCMGDVLLHLPSLEDVRILFKKAYESLVNNGRLILAFRDLSKELTGLDRFIPVRSDAEKIFTCFLEYEEEYVRVHDILYEKTDRQWQMKKSFFLKLRVPPGWAEKILEGLGFRIEAAEIEKGLVVIVAFKP
jgi:2-polyprenyl-3-methyl-5-hydroxy-6-metoxy-1,4-benzoquinol methylase